MEQLNLSSPAVVTSNNCQVRYLGLDVAGLTIVIELLYDSGKLQSVIYNSIPSPTGATGASLLHQLNTGNFTNNSLHKSLFTQLKNDGYLAGTVTGTPL
jgi:hypothetical protein